MNNTTNQHSLKKKKERKNCYQRFTDSQIPKSHNSNVSGRALIHNVSSLPRGKRGLWPLEVQTQRSEKNQADLSRLTLDITL